MTYKAHETAIIDPGVRIGDDTRIWHWVHVCDGAEIGRDCSLGQNVFVRNNVQIGNNVRIQNNVSVYEGVTVEGDGEYECPHTGDVYRLKNTVLNLSLDAVFA